MRYSNYCGNENVAFIYYNEWADPKIEYKGFQWSAWMIEDALREMMLEENLPDTDSQLAAYINANVENYLDDCLAGMDYFDVDFIQKNAPSWFEQLRDEIAYGDDDYIGYRHVTDSEVLDKYAGIAFTLNDFAA